jgi:Flp pilus assembly protein TadG
MSIARMLGSVRGTAAIEFAMVAPLFFMLVCGVIEGGLLTWTQAGLQHGAQAAARCASINPAICGTNSDIQAYAAHQAFGLPVNPSTFTFTVSACGNQVSANYTFDFFSGYFGMPSLALTAQACYPK